MPLPRLTTMKNDGLLGQYELLPSTHPVDLTRRIARFRSSRRRFLFLCLLALLFLLFVATLNQHSSSLGQVWDKVKYSTPQRIIPPNYEEYYKTERAYPQHNASLAFPEGKDGRFVWVSSQVWGLGWNNVFQTLYMLSQMAYLSNSAFVFKPYTWHAGSEPYVQYRDGNLIPSRIPLAALMAGPIAGGPFPEDLQPAPPRAVSEEWFKTVCPPERTRVINVKEVNAGLVGADALDVMNKYVEVLTEAMEGCIELRGGLDHPFGIDHFGSKGILSAWPMLSESPILRNLEWSPLALTALRVNAPIITPELANETLPNIIHDLAAIHVRRGDYDTHCHHLANWSSSYMGWTQFPEMPDKFVVPEGGGWGENTPENTAMYMEHCWPDIDQIVNRVRNVRREWEARPNARPLRRLYILTNGEREWVSALKKKLSEQHEWGRVTSSRDLDYTLEQKYIAQAIDMAIAERAALFVGNGFSSLTANVVLLRSVRVLAFESNRFW